MPTSPEVVRRGLQVVTSAAQADLQAVSSAAGGSPETWRSAMFAAAPLIVAEYAPGSAEIALEWFEEIRLESVGTGFTPTPRLNMTDAAVSAAVATITEPVRRIEEQIEREAQALLAELTSMLADEIAREVATGFWDTVVENTADDPEAVGWQRFARPGACKFCLMLAARGAVYTEETARFAAHGAVTGGKRSGGNCMCVAGPSYDANAPRASVLQYVASRRQRTEKERADLRDYLNHHFPDAPG